MWGGGQSWGLEMFEVISQLSVLLEKLEYGGIRHYTWTIQCFCHRVFLHVNCSKNDMCFLYQTGLNLFQVIFVV